MSYVQCNICNISDASLTIEFLAKCGLVSRIEYGECMKESQSFKKQVFIEG